VKLFGRGRAKPVEQFDAECQMIARADNRSVVTVRGAISELTVRPVDDSSALEASISDGTDSVTLVWLGRHKIEGIRVGRRIVATGRIGRRGAERIMYNPRYELEV
jgi:RecG-like helicase